MTIVTYNLRAGGAGRTHWARVVEAFAPDLFFAQESAPPAEHLPELTGAAA